MKAERNYAKGWSHRASCGLPLVLSSILWAVMIEFSTVLRLLTTSK